MQQRRILTTIALTLVVTLLMTHSSRAQSDYRWPSVDIGAPRNANSANTGLNIHDGNDGGNYTNIQLVEKGWSASHAILFNAYKSASPVNGSIAATGNTKYANGPGSYSTGSGMIGFFGNGGALDFYISPPSTGQNNNVNWGAPKLRVRRDGTVSIGSATAIGEQLHVVDPSGSSAIFLGGNGTAGPNGIVFDDSEPGKGVQLMWRTDPNRLTIEKTSAGTGTNGADAFWYDRDTDYFYFDGRVGIGTGSPSHKLTVNGTIRAKEVRVETGWSDFVFDDDYDLPTLDEVQAHIDTHGHLPGMPSADQVAAQGLSLGESDARLLQKIEELTLYTLAQQEEIDALGATVDALEARLAALEAAQD